MSELDEFEYNNEEEAEVAQILSLQYANKGLQKIREENAKREARPSLEECEQCGEDIPKERQLAIKGCTTCIFCQEINERRKNGFL